MLLINVDMIICMNNLGAPQVLILMVPLMIGKFVMSKIPILLHHTPLIVQVRKSSYSSVPNRRAIRNKPAGGKILKKH